MSYIAGFDGGATKTHCVLGDSSGNILSEGFSGGSHYQFAGVEGTGEAIKDALNQALNSLDIPPEQLDYTVLGLAGADFDTDFEILNGICGAIFPPGKFSVINDMWIGLRAGIPENWGIVSNCGTGGACAGRSRDGREVMLRNLSYETGNRGGGLEITRIALHRAFRSEEGTGLKTALEEEIPKTLGAGSLEELIAPALAMEIRPDAVYEIPVLVGKLALMGDVVCQDIFLEVGASLGEIAGGVIRRLGMGGDSFKVTLTGSVFNSECPLLKDAFTAAVHRAAPYAAVAVAERKPALGAYELALDCFNANRQGRC